MSRNCNNVVFGRFVLLQNDKVLPESPRAEYPADAVVATRTGMGVVDPDSGEWVVFDTVMELEDWQASKDMAFANQEVAEQCDKCGKHVENGDGFHVGDDRLCADCNDPDAGVAMPGNWVVIEGGNYPICIPTGQLDGDEIIRRHLTFDAKRGSRFNDFRDSMEEQGYQYAYDDGNLFIDCGKNIYGTTYSVELLGDMFYDDSLLPLEIMLFDFYEREKVVIGAGDLDTTDEEKYLDWVNNFLTLQAWADHYAMTFDEANDLIRRVKKARQENIDQKRNIETGVTGEELLVCHRCGAEDCQHAHWVNTNTLEVGAETVDAQSWCPECDSETTLIHKSEYRNFLRFDDFFEARDYAEKHDLNKGYSCLRITQYENQFVIERDPGNLPGVYVEKTL